MIATGEELEGYLHQLAWSRYHLHYEPDPGRAQESLSPAQVRAAIGETQNRLRWQVLQGRAPGAGPRGRGREDPR